MYIYAGHRSLLSVEEIASADIILTTYDALRTDVYHDGTHIHTYMFSNTHIPIHICKFIYLCI